MRFQAPAQFGNQPSMKISEIKTFLVGSTRGEQEEPATSGPKLGLWKILTDQGFTESARLGVQSRKATVSWSTLLREGSRRRPENIQTYGTECLTAFGDGYI